MRIGQMDQWISIEENTPSDNSEGESVASWAEITDGGAWAKVYEKGGKEVFSSDHVSAEVDAIFTVWHRTDVNKKMRISYDSRYYNIYSMNGLRLGRDKFLEIHAQAIRD